MHWIHHYQLFLFDFDGLLVNTEEIHYQAYQRMCTQRGVSLHWDFNRYSEAAHHDANGLRDQIYANFPELFNQEPNWSVLYEEKKQAFLKLLQEGAAQLMPGVPSLLKALEQAQIPRCVVTHSATSIVTLLRQQNPILNTIPHWITREDYTHPKPDPECYRTAISRLAKKSDKIIGFEDSPRGLKALLETPAQAVLICPLNYPYVQEVLSPSFKYYPSFEAITDENFP